MTALKSLLEQGRFPRTWLPRDVEQIVARAMSPSILPVAIILVLKNPRAGALLGRFNALTTIVNFWERERSKTFWYNKD